MWLHNGLRLRAAHAWRYNTTKRMAVFEVKSNQELQMHPACFSAKVEKVILFNMWCNAPYAVQDIFYAQLEYIEINA